MSLYDFKSQNATDKIWVNTGKPNAFGRPSKKYSFEVPTPLCTDQLRGFPGDVVTLAEGEVFCNVSPGVANPDGLVVAGQRITRVLYYFYQNRLYKIELYLLASQFSPIKSAFNQKYGDATLHEAKTYKNGFGANWTGQVLGWKAGAEIIGLEEGPANGPGQDASDPNHPSIAIFLDQSHQPPTGNKPVVDF